MSKGAATVTYTWVENGEHSAGCPLEQISSDERLKRLIAENRLQSIHSSEPTLNDIFMDITGRTLFFMGAIVLLEKSQHTTCALAVSPVHAAEYVIAKVCSLSAISLVVAAILALAADANHLHIVLFGTFLSSVIFTLSGIIVATKITGLNQFILWTVPIEAICFVPAILHLFKITPAWCRYYPVNVCMDMVSGHSSSATGFLGVVAMMVILFVISGFCVSKMWDSMGGVKL